MRQVDLCSALNLILIGLCASAPSLQAAAIDGVRLDPSKIFLQGPDSSQHLLVTAIDVNGDETDVTASCRFEAVNPEIARVEEARIIGNAPGETKVKAFCGETSAEVAITVGNRSSEMQVNFARDVMSILTTKGCNGSACHGSPAGQNGFKLSLYASAPAADHEMIVHGHEGRRVNLEEPEKSLLLQKPSFQIAHGGGQLMTPESEQYQTLLRWLKQGAKFEEGGTRLEALEIYPRERILVGAGSQQKFVVVGRLSDGTARDMSEQVRYSVDDEAIVSAVEDGAVTAKSRGLTIVSARAFGKVATSQLIVIDERAGADYPAIESNNFIDEHIFAKLRKVNIEPFPIAPDRVLLRRVYLNAIGVLPTLAETRAFVNDPHPDKRARLVNDLLEREEYTDHWMVKFEDWFRNSQYYSQGRTNASYKRWIREMVRQDRPYDEAVREMLTAVGDTTVRPAGNFWHPAIDFMLKTFEVSKAVPTVTRLFLGKRIECAECHNHPLENLTQDDFYGMAAFLGRLKVKHGYGQYRRIWYNTREGEVLHPVTKEPVAPKFLDGKKPDIPDGVDRRQVLADWITRTQKMQFARATVNRIWAQYFGAGIVDPFDDFRSTNMPTHPELLDRLAEYFIDSGFRFKALHRLILTSKAYQLSAHTPERPGGTDPLEEKLFARFVPRKLPAEVLLDAIVQVTGVPHKFRNYPLGTSPKNLIASIGAPYFLTTFGFPRRDTMEPREGKPSLSQALHLTNSDNVLEKVEADDNILGRLLGGGLQDNEVLDELYLRAYSRLPTEEQRLEIGKFLAAEQEAGRSRRGAWEHVLWAILNSKEFQLNQ